MNLQDHILILLIVIVFVFGINVIFSDMVSKGLNLNEEDLAQMSQTQEYLSEQEKFFDTEFISSNELEKETTWLGGVKEYLGDTLGINELSKYAKLPSMFNGLQALLNRMFPAAMSGFLAWFIGLAMFFYGLFVSIEIYFAVRGNKAK